MNSEIDNFTAEVKMIGGSKIVVIPPVHIKYSGIEVGDLVKIYYKKHEAI